MLPTGYAEFFVSSSIGSDWKEFFVFLFEIICSPWRVNNIIVPIALFSTVLTVFISILASKELWLGSGSAEIPREIWGEYEHRAGSRDGEI